MNTHVDLCSGIGGFALAAKLTGFRTVLFSEIEPYCQKVLALRFPGVPIDKDLTKLKDIPFCDVLTAGTPCQNISIAASRNRVGVNGAKSVLWRDVWRLVKLRKPKFIILENSATIIRHGLSEILEAFAGIGYDAEWYRFEPKQFGLPQKRRQRCYIIFYPIGFGDRLPQGKIFTGWDKPKYSTWRGAKSRILRVPNGVPNRVDRHKAIGNAICPPIAIEIFRALKKTL